MVWLNFCNFHPEMKFTALLFGLCFTITIYSQNTVKATLVSSKALDCNSFVGVDNFNAIYTITNNALYKNGESQNYDYSNVQLGNIYSANIFNALKINLFYKDLNTVIILDNRLAEIIKLDFNTIDYYRNASHISTGNDNSIWLFNQDSNELELFDYLNATTLVKTLPIAEDVITITSNYNNCWVLTKQHIYQYNYFGSLVQKLPNTGFTDLRESNDDIVLLKDNNLFLLPKSATETLAITLPELLIKQFSVVGEIVYIYDGKNLHKHQLKSN